MHIGFIFWTNTAGTELRPANWLARVLLAADRDAAIATRRPREEVLDSLSACAAPNGRLLTSGVFIGLQRLGRFGTPDAIYGWYVLPGRLEGERVIDRVALQREGSSGPVALEFEVAESAVCPSATPRSGRGAKAQGSALSGSRSTSARSAFVSRCGTEQRGDGDTARRALVLQRSTELERSKTGSRTTARGVRLRGGGARPGQRASLSRQPPLPLGARALLAGWST